VILYAASWAWTHPKAREQRILEPADPVQGPPLPSVDELAAEGKSRTGAFAAGAAVGAAAAAVTKGRSKDS
jgi:membrane protein